MLPPSWWLILLLVDQAIAQASQWISYPDSGTASLTHYTIPAGFVTACGCPVDSANYPTAALSQMAYGSSHAYGPACGMCFNLTLQTPVFATPPFHPSVVKHIVVKITDLCPMPTSSSESDSGSEPPATAGYCSGTTTSPNSVGEFLNFDLAFPSHGIPDDFFPSDVAVYGYSDFGVWTVTYQTVSCANWQGFNASASDPPDSEEPHSGTCCPADPTPSNACPSFSDEQGLPPE